MCDIDPKDIETWSVTSSSTSGGGGSHPGNGNNQSGDSENNSGKPIRPELGGGFGGLNIDESEEN